MNTLLKPVIAAFSLALAIVPVTASAQEAVSLEGSVKVERTVSEDGTVTTFLEDPATVVPGDRLLFVTNYQNKSVEIVEDFVVTNPLPSAITLAEESDAFDVSIDGGKTFGALSHFTVANAGMGARPASLADVTHVRWTLAALEPGAAGELRYYATVR